MRFQPKTPKEGVNYSRDNPLREVAVLLVAAAVLGALLFVSLGWAIEFAAPLIPPRWELRVFAGLGRLLDAQGFTKAEPKLQRLADRLAAHWPDSPYAFEVFVDQSEEPNAFAVPGGCIVVTRGLLEQSDSENELAFVLGHEMGHFRGRDHLRAIGRSTAFALMRWVVNSSLGLGAPQSFVLAERLTESSYSRAQESSADEFGLSLVQAEYGHLGGALDFLRRDEQQGIGRNLSAWTSTHPLTDDRIAALEETARRRGWSLRGETLPAIHPNRND